MSVDNQSRISPSGGQCTTSLAGLRLFVGIIPPPTQYNAVPRILDDLLFSTAEGDEEEHDDLETSVADTSDGEVSLSEEDHDQEDPSEDGSGGEETAEA